MQPYWHVRLYRKNKATKRNDARILGHQNEKLAPAQELNWGRGVCAALTKVEGLMISFWRTLPGDGPTLNTGSVRYAYGSYLLSSTIRTNLIEFIFSCFFSFAFDDSDSYRQLHKLLNWQMRLDFEKKGLIQLRLILNRWLYWINVIVHGLKGIFCTTRA